MRAEDEATKTPSGTPSVITDLEKSRRCVLIHWITNFGNRMLTVSQNRPAGCLVLMLIIKGFCVFKSAITMSFELRASEGKGHTAAAGVPAKPEDRAKQKDSEHGARHKATGPAFHRPAVGRESRPPKWPRRGTEKGGAQVRGVGRDRALDETRGTATRVLRQSRTCAGTACHVGPSEGGNDAAGERPAGGRGAEPRDVRLLPAGRHAVPAVSAAGPSCWMRPGSDPRLVPVHPDRGRPPHSPTHSRVGGLDGPLS